MTLTKTICLALSITVAIMTGCIQHNELLEEGPSAVKRMQPKRNAIDIAKLKSKAESGDPVFQDLLATCYLVGDSTPVNETEAAKWYQKSAYQGYPPALRTLAHFFKHGMGGLPENPIEAYALYTVAISYGECDVERQFLARKMDPKSIEAGERRAKEIAAEVKANLLVYAERRSKEEAARNEECR